MTFGSLKLDTTVNLGMIGITFLYLVTAVWFSSKLDSRITDLENSHNFQVQRNVKEDEYITQLKTDLAVAKEDITSVLTIVRRLEDHELATGSLPKNC